ncbi:MAG: hypothetical protein ABL958_01670 [Bdellovibrionia bacterium]
MKALILIATLVGSNVFAQIPIVPPSATPPPKHTDSLQSFQDLVLCKSPGVNPLTSKTKVTVRKYKDGRMFAQVEGTRLGGMELKALSLVTEKREEGKSVPVEYKGETVDLIVSDKRKEGGGWFGGSDDYLSQVAYTDLKGASFKEGVLCRTPSTW